MAHNESSARRLVATEYMKFPTENINYILNDVFADQPRDQFAVRDLRSTQGGSLYLDNDVATISDCKLCQLVLI